MVMDFEIVTAIHIEVEINLISSRDSWEGQSLWFHSRVGVDTNSVGSR